MPEHYKKVPDSTKRKTFPEPRNEPHQYKEPIGPQKPPTLFQRATGAIRSGASQFAENARRDAGRHERSGGRRRQNDNPLAMIAPPSYYGGMPGMHEPVERRAPAKRRKRRRRTEREDDTPDWQRMSAVPPEVRRWMF